MKRLKEYLTLIKYKLTLAWTKLKMKVTTRMQKKKNNTFLY